MRTPEIFPRLRDAIVQVLDKEINGFAETLVGRRDPEAPSGVESSFSDEARAEAEALFGPADLCREVLAGRKQVERLDERLEPVRGLDAWLRSLANANMTHWFQILVERRIGTGHVGPGFQHEGVRYVFHDYRERPLFLVSGQASIRAAYYCREGRGEGIYPIDLILGLDRSGCTREAAFLMAHFSAEADYPSAEALIERATGLRIDQNRLHRKIETLGSTALALQDNPAGPNTPPEPPPRMVVETDGLMVLQRHDPEQADPDKAKAGWHEGHVGVVAVPEVADVRPPKYQRKDRSPERAVQTKADSHLDVRLEQPTYLATYEGREAHLRKLKAEAVRRGWTSHTQTEILGDGSAWVHEDTRDLFPRALHVLDWHHAVSHLAKVRDLAYTPGSPEGAAWFTRNETNLWEGDPTSVIRSIRYLAGTSRAGAARKLRTEARYFRERVGIMDYPAYRKAGWPIGSGAVESACRHVVQERCKGAGMRWSSKGVRNVLAVRTAILNDRFNEVWASHVSRSPFREAA
jgi:hypothetical protein